VAWFAKTDAQSPTLSLCTILTCACTYSIDTTSSCNIPFIPNLSTSDFVRNFKGRSPVIFSRPLNDTQLVRSLLHRKALLDNYGAEEVILASSESYSHVKRTTSLSYYITEIMRTQEPDSLANESWYLFGDTLGPEWALLVASYPLPMDSAADNGDPCLGLRCSF